MLHLDTDMTIDEKDPAPSTPQLKQVSRLLDGDCQENINCSMENVNSPTEKENIEDQDIGESKFVDTTNRELNDDIVVVKEEKGDSEKEEEEEGENGDLRSEKIDSVNCHKKEDDIKPINKSSGIKHLPGNKTSRKKVMSGLRLRSIVLNDSSSRWSLLSSSFLQVDWTPELHKKFVQAVEQLGVDQAIPSRILELMKADGLTRHNVASHLQVNWVQKVECFARWFEFLWNVTESFEFLSRNFGCIGGIFFQRRIITIDGYNLERTIDNFNGITTVFISNTAP